jgi:hypothetical protein
VSESKHTQGQWEARKEGYFWTIVSEGQPEIGQILHVADARLISAAPELLEALKECISALYEAVQIAPLDRLPDKAGGAIQQAQYVIAKAEGNA